MDSFDGVENLRLGEAPDPEPGPNQVLLRVRFAALNPADAFLAQAMYPAKPPLPHILGRDGVGEVIAVGAGVSNVKAGDTVGILRCDCGVELWGTLAEKVARCGASVAPPPAGWSLEQTAGAPLVYLTAWQALTQWSDPPSPPPAGSVLLVTGASGGVGTASVQLGKSMGLTVVALSRSAEKGAKLRALGADHVFDPADPNLRKAVMAAIAPKKVDIVVDNVGGALFNQVHCDVGIRRAHQRGGPERRRSPQFQYRGAVFQAQSDRRSRGVGLYRRAGPGGVERDYGTAERDGPEASGGSRVRI